MQLDLSKCLECGRPCESPLSLSRHLTAAHKLSSKAYYIKHFGQGVCKVCGNPTRFDRLATGFKVYCSAKCRSADPETLAKRKETCMRLYGVDHPVKAASVQAKTQATNLQRHGVSCALLSQQAKDTNLERYGDTVPMRSAAVKAKLKASVLTKYGVEYSGQIEDSKRKAAASNFQKYGVKCVLSKPEVRQLSASAIMEKFGVDNVLKLPEVRAQVEQSNLAKYGAKPPFESSAIRDKAKQAVLQKYGVDNIFKSPEFIESLNALK